MSTLVVFSVDVPRLATFYAAVLGAEPTAESSGDIRLLHDEVEVLVHSLPAGVAEAIEVRVPPAPRQGASIKPVFDVDSLEMTLPKVEENGGVRTGMTFTIDGVTRHDVLDPDGNVIQLRGRSSSFTG